MNHYRLEPPFCLMFSGGETSAFMLRQVLDAYDGELPEESAITFTNTGVEHEETLKFIHRVETEWDVPVVWLEYAGPGEYNVVDFESASREGEPFIRLLELTGWFPTPRARLCTSHLKMRTASSYLKSFDWDEWDNALGLRADEPHRVHRIKPDRKGERPVCPMYHAGHSLDDVEAYWSASPWRLGIERWLGNCCGCFLKSRARLDRLADEHPELMEWWAKLEERFGRPFRIDRPTYRQMLTQVTVQGRLFGDDGPDDSLPCTCTD